MRLRRPVESEPDEFSELAGVADGVLAPRRREVVEARVAASPELAALLAEQRQAVSIVRGAAPEIQAPAGLQKRIAAQRAEARGRRRPLVLTGSFATAAAAAALAIVLILPAGVAAPSVAQAALFTARPATAPAPLPVPGRPKRLARAVEGVPFPNFSKKFGWKAVGSRVDGLDGHRAVTVFYTKRGLRIGYVILSGKPLRVPKGAETIARRGTTFHVLALGPDRAVVSWVRAGHTSVLSGTTGACPSRLVKFATWLGSGTLPS